MTTLDKIRAEIADLDDAEYEFEGYYKAVNDALQIIDKYAEQEPSRDIKEIAEIMKCGADAETKCKMISNILTAKPHYFAEQEPISVSVSEKEPDEISEEVTLRFFRNSLKVRWQDMVIYNVEWLKKNWQMEMDIVCGVKPCDDAVSRQAVLEIAKQHTLTNDYLAIQNLPSVNPQPKTGHWINDEVGCYYCSECCGYVASHDDAYCRYCGAKMVEPRESEDRE